MKIKLILLLLTITCLETFAQEDLKLWYKQPARNWNEALPVGNGRLGAMVFGKVGEELIQLNEETLWSGGPANLNPNPGVAKYLPEIRKALANEDYKKAEDLTKNIQGLFTESYEPLGDLILKQELKGDASNYRRTLDISKAISTTSFNIGTTAFSREVFVSAPDQVIVIRLTSSEKGALNFTASTTSPLFHANAAIASDQIVMKGVAPSHVDPNYSNTMEPPVLYNDPAKCRGMRFELRLKMIRGDGKVTSDSTGLHIQAATEVVLVLSAATSFNGFDKCPDKDGKNEVLLAEQYLKKIEGKDFNKLKEDHIADYQKYFNRVSLVLNGNPKVDKPMDERLMAYSKGDNDPELEATYFQFGRYLLISSSHPGGIPANLQGIWNHHVRPPWSSNFTTNINTQMNYWMVESANLSELHSPLFDLIGELAKTGRETTRNFYGGAGWTVHHNTDIWATSNPVSGSPMWANWPMGGAWLSQHLWEHYQFTGDREYLSKTAYPLMKSAAEFVLSWLVEDSQGRLVTAPSTSPENEYITDKGVKGTVSVATTMDMSIIWDLFTNLIQSSERLQTDEEFRKLLIEKRSKLFPLQIGKKGNLQEWYKDWEDQDPQHRHISHLFGLFPGRQISPLTTQKYANAVRKSMELRGDGGTGWSKGWKINIWARLLDGNHAYKLIREQLKLTGVEGTDYANGGGTYPNLLDAHPPFQIDGNFGGTSGMVEMLVQSQDGVVNILPALPDQWPTGNVKGLKVRGGFEVDINWANGKIKQLNVRSALGGNCRLRVKTPLKVSGKASMKIAKGTNANVFFTKAAEIQDQATALTKDIVEYDLATEAGKEYILKGGK